MRHDPAGPETRAREETISERGREARENRMRSVRRYAGMTVALAFLFGIGLAASAGHDLVVLVVESLALLAAAAAAFVVAFGPSRGGRPELAEAHARTAARARQ
ncbi:MAG: hypothetical protein M3N24_04140, partial [Actinomycetota bacterium]|nr:hypothetical protein [Actinomycetota bacterium]